ncbi:MAG TPA: hypothetical protein VN581_02235 [Patescibacteria group bacterium]|nr:hypothetical protein [Patescibacteria group bacterium]
MSVPPRSMFVSATAWSLIVVGGLGILLAGMIAFLAVMLGVVGTEQVFDENPLFGLLPPMMQWLMRHLGVLAAVLFVTSVAALPLGIALNRRREWARVASVWSCWGLALLHVAVLPLQWQQMAAWRDAISFTMPAFVRASIDSMYWPLQVSSAVMTFALGVALGWTAWKLMRVGIRAEFQ